MIDFFKLIRYQNLLMIALVQLLIKYAVLNPFNVDVSLTDFQYWLLVLATMAIAAGGNVINDIYDVQIDRINKPEKVIIGKKITEKTANNYFIVLNVIGVGIGFYLANSIGKPGFSAIFIVFSALLYLYATYLRPIVVISNLVVAFLVAMSLLIVGIFDLFPAITEDNREAQSAVFTLLLNYSLFAFILTFIREIVKDSADIKGDQNGGRQTIPILIGINRSNKVLFVLGVFAILCVVYYIYTVAYLQQLVMLYFLLLIVAPLIYFCIKILTAQKPKEFDHLSRLLKVIMFFGMLSLLFYSYILL